MGRIEDLVDFLRGVRAVPAITSIILGEVLGGGSERTHYLFPSAEKETILLLLRNQRLELFDLPEVNSLSDRILADLKRDFWRRYMHENSRDYLIALTALWAAQKKEMKAVIVTENISDFECWRIFELDCLNSSEIDAIRYG